MGYFKEKMRKLVIWATSDDYDNRKYASGIASLQKINQANTIGSNSLEGHNGGLNFTVYSATGGKVVQIRTYNIATDRSTSMLYIISDKEDLGKELGHIITIESLSR
jgi:hypothetical protein